MTDSTKIITVLILVSLLTTVIGSYVILKEVSDINTRNAAPQIIIIHDDGDSSGKATVTILAPSGTRGISSAEAKINING